MGDAVNSEIESEKPSQSSPNDSKVRIYFDNDDPEA